MGISISAGISMSIGMSKSIAFSKSTSKRIIHIHAVLLFKESTME